MLDIVIHYSPSDREVATAIAARLQRGAEAKVWLEECRLGDGQSIASVWETADSGGGALLLLSQNLIPVRLDRRHWEPLLTHVERNAAPRLGAVLLGDCPYPRLLERTHFFRWIDGTREAIRAIERWVLSFHTPDEHPSFAPASLPWFQERRRELDIMWENLVDEAGAIVLVNPVPGSGKTSLAQQFAHAARGHFRDILWVACGSRPRPSCVSDLGHQLGVALEASTENVLDRISRTLQEHRLLVVFDDLTEEALIVTSPEGRASVLITTRSSKFRLPPRARVMQIENTIPPVLPDPPEDSAEARLLHAISVCRPHGFPLELAAGVAGLDENEARDACQRLVDGRWIDPFDPAGERFRMGAGVLTIRRQGAEYEEFRRRHADALKEAMSSWRVNVPQCRDLLPEFEVAFDWAIQSDWPRANGLADRAFAFLCNQQRLPEAIQIGRRVIEAAEARQDKPIAERWTWELSWIQEGDGGVRRLPNAGDQLPLFDLG
jgi:NB-ARC domain